MRYPASEKLEIIRTVETSPLPARRTLAKVMRIMKQSGLSSAALRCARLACAASTAAFSWASLSRMASTSPLSTLVPSSTRSQR